MLNSTSIDLSSIIPENQPFPHFSSSTAFTESFSAEVFNWLNQTENWKLSQTDFYEQYEFSLLETFLPKNLEHLVSSQTISLIEAKFVDVLKTGKLSLVGIVAHKLVDGQHIGIHNDFINREETHRLVIHLSPDWNEDNGGFLMLFNSAKAEDVANVISPVFNSAFGFEISNHSHHAVSKIYNFTRYTVVYTFKED